jgi:membrane protease YdiL (CAAX protease family)
MLYEACSVLNTFQSSPRALRSTITVIAAVTVLVGLEKFLIPHLSARGELYAAVCTILVIASKTIIPLLLLWKINKLNPGNLGWVNGGLFQALAKAVVLALVMLVFAGLYQKYSFLIFGTPYASTGGNALQGKTSYVAISLLLIASLLNAFGEEIIFRGMLMPVLSKYTYMSSALVVQSLIFTIYHFFPLQNSVLLFCLGILFGLGYLWSGSLLTPVLAHLIENGAGSAVFLFHKLF